LTVSHALAFVTTHVRARITRPTSFEFHAHRAAVLHHDTLHRLAKRDDAAVFAHAARERVD
jgi:hypothetical protein